MVIRVVPSGFCNVTALLSQGTATKRRAIHKLSCELIYEKVPAGYSALADAAVL